jgi:hypothetical protein
LTLWTGCLTTTQSAPAGVEAAIVQRARATRAWIAEEQGQAIGSVVRFEDSSAGDRAIYVVRDAWGEDLGLVDALGRVWRMRPHKSKLEGLGSGTVAEGVERILGPRTSLVLREVSLGELAAPLRELPDGGEPLEPGD